MMVKMIVVVVEVIVVMPVEVMVVFVVLINDCGGDISIRPSVCLSIRTTP